MRDQKPRDLNAQQPMELAKPFGSDTTYEIIFCRLDEAVGMFIHKPRSLRQQMVELCLLRGLSAATDAEHVALWLLDHEEPGCKENGYQLLEWIANTYETPTAMAHLALEKSYGENCHQDFELSNYLIHRVLEIEKGAGRLRSLALGLLAKHTANGWGVPVDHAQARQLFLQVAQPASPSLAYEAARFFDGEYASLATDGNSYIDRDKAAELYEHAMNGGIGQAQIDLALLHLTRDITDKNFDYGKELLRRAAADGDREALRAIEIQETIEILTLERPLQGNPQARSRWARTQTDFEHDVCKLLTAVYEDLPQVLEFMDQIRDAPEDNNDYVLDAMDSYPGGREMFTKECATRRELIEAVLAQRDTGMNDTEFVTILHRCTTKRGRSVTLAQLKEHRKLQLQ